MQSWSHGLSPTDRERVHRQQRKLVHAFLDQCRGMVGLESYWQVQVVVCCAGELADAEAQISFQPDTWYAQLWIRCGLSPKMIHWLVLHELCELQMYRSAQLMAEVRILLEQVLPDIQVDILENRYRVIRNQEIESRVYGLLGEAHPVREEARR